MLLNKGGELRQKSPANECEKINLFERFAKAAPYVQVDMVCIYT